MKHFILIFTLAICALNVNAQKSKITTFILVRHAEKAVDGTEDPDLKAEGIERAAKLASMLRETPVDAVYSTNFKRTKNTVLPFATAKGLQLQSYEAFKVEAIEGMLKKHEGGTVLICGHSNNIPWIANLLIGKEEYKNYTDGEYGIMLIVSVVEKGKLAKVTRLNY